MQENGSSAHQYPLSDLDVVQATAHLSPLPGLVRLSFDVTPEEAHRIAYLCSTAHQAGFAGRTEQAALWARNGRPPQTFLPTHAEVRATRELYATENAEGQLYLFPVHATTEPGA